MERSGLLADQVQCSLSPDDFVALNCLKTGSSLEQSFKLPFLLTIWRAFPAPQLRAQRFLLGTRSLPKLDPGLSPRLWSHLLCCPGSEEAVALSHRSPSRNGTPSLKHGILSFFSAF